MVLKPDFHESTQVNQYYSIEPKKCIKKKLHSYFCTFPGYQTLLNNSPTDFQGLMTHSCELLLIK
jgi:hypothetical protein